MTRSGSTRIALRITAATAAVLATSLGSGVSHAAAAPAAAAPVLTYQQQWSGAATSRTSNLFSAPAPALWLGGQCGATGTADNGQVGLFDVTEGNELEAVSQVFPCTNQIYRTPAPVPADPGHVYKMVIKTDGVSPNQGVYAWR